MYYPILRGRQNELLAIRELLNRSKLSDKIIPLIEPVKISPTLISTLEAFDNSSNHVSIIWNPKVGSFFSDMKNEKNAKYINKLNDILESNTIHRALYVDKNNHDFLDEWSKNGFDISKIIAICTDADSIKYYDSSMTGNRILAPYLSAFRRIRKNRIILEDKFNKKPKNADYKNEPDEFFSDDHLYYRDEGYIGFSDYSIIGEEYSESGFAPRAVAIHIVYFDENKALRIRHFVSNDNEDTSDPAHKFYEALVQFIEWNNDVGLNTIAAKEFERIYKEESYPGLGVIKKLSIMNHLELVSDYLDGKI